MSTTDVVGRWPVLARLHRMVGLTEQFAAEYDRALARRCPECGVGPAMVCLTVDGSWCRRPHGPRRRS